MLAAGVTDGKSEATASPSPAGVRRDPTGRIGSWNGNIFALCWHRDDGLDPGHRIRMIDGQLLAPHRAAGKGAGVSGTLKAVNADGSGGRIEVNGQYNLATANLSAAARAEADRHWLWQSAWAATPRMARGSFAGRLTSGYPAGTGGHLVDRCRRSDRHRDLAQCGRLYG